jgi:hypothetical protein
VKVWRYKRQNRTSYRTSQQCEGVKIQTTEQNIVSDITIVWRCDVLFCHLYLHTFTLLWCPIRCSVLSFVSSYLHTVVMSDTMFCSVVCIFTPSHCCDVRYDTVWRCEDTNDRTEHSIRHHNSVKVWRYKRQNRTSYRTHLHTVVMSDTMFCSVFCIFTPSHCCGVWYHVLFCRLYLHTLTLLNSVKVWRYKRQNRTSYPTPQQCEGVKIQKTEQNIASDITTVWRCEDTNDRTEHRL